MGGRKDHLDIDNHYECAMEWKALRIRSEPLLLHGKMPFLEEAGPHGWPEAPPGPECTPPFYFVNSNGYFIEDTHIALRNKNYFDVQYRKLSIPLILFPSMKTMISNGRGKGGKESREEGIQGLSYMKYLPQDKCIFQVVLLWLII